MRTFCALLIALTALAGCDRKSQSAWKESIARVQATLPAKCTFESTCSVTVAWDPPDDRTGIVGYKVYYGNAPRAYTQSYDAGDRFQATITGLTAGTYYFAAVSYSTSAESDYSNEVGTKF